MSLISEFPVGCPVQDAPNMPQQFIILCVCVCVGSWKLMVFTGQSPLLAIALGPSRSEVAV